MFWLGFNENDWMLISAVWPPEHESCTPGSWRVRYFCFSFSFCSVQSLHVAVEFTRLSCWFCSNDSGFRRRLKTRLPSREQINCKPERGIVLLMFWLFFLSSWKYRSRLDNSLPLVQSVCPCMFQSLRGSQGLPVGVQVVCLRYKDEMVLRIMKELQAAADYTLPLQQP